MEIANGAELIETANSKFYRVMYNNKNIGDNAENLTIVILSYNRVKATVYLINSLLKIFPYYKGKIIIADNGSTKESINQLEKFISNCSLEINLIKFEKNLGVAKGRNESVKNVQTDWLMFLDNDIYFIRNIFPDIKRTIETLGCKFLNLGLLDKDEKTLFSYGGNIFITPLEKSIHIGCGSTYQQKELSSFKLDKPCLASFLLGGCSVINKKAFIDCGKFDENMKIGFEDIDFSIRLFNEGYKIGCCNSIGLVHNHVKTESKDDMEYEKTRFSSKTLYESAQYFEKKNNLKVWTEETEKWLKQREKDLNIVKNEEKKVEKLKKSKITLVVDTRNWALDNIAQNIVKNLKDKYEFRIIYMDEIPDNNIVLLFYACLNSDIIHFLWRGLLTYLSSDFTQEYLNKYRRGYRQYKLETLDNFTITTSIYDHSYLGEDINITEDILKYITEYTVSSQKLWNIYQKLKVKKPLMEITDGVDLEKFYPINIERFSNVKSRTIHIGWVGNSNWSGDSKKDHKGLNTIIKPAVEELIREGYNIKLELTDKQEKMIPHNEMVKFYSKLDIYICGSMNEGTPNPVLEAMACGVPIISTDVGIVSEVFGKKQLKYILKERSKECLKEKIKEFISSLDEIKELSSENILQIKEWDWKKKCKQFDDFFQKVIDKKEK